MSGVDARCEKVNVVHLGFVRPGLFGQGAMSFTYPCIPIYKVQGCGDSRRLRWPTKSVNTGVPSEMNDNGRGRARCRKTLRIPVVILFIHFVK